MYFPPTVGPRRYAPMSLQSPVVRARVAKLRTGFLAGGGVAPGEVPGDPAAVPEACTGGEPTRQKVVISSLNQVIVRPSVRRRNPCVCKNLHARMFNVCTNMI